MMLTRRDILKLGGITAMTLLGFSGCIKNRLKDVKVGIIYQSIVDEFTIKHRGVDWLKKMVNDLNVDLIFRAFWKRNQSPEIYSTLKLVIEEIKSSKDVIIVGGLPAQTIWQIDYDFDEDRVLRYPDTWELALDPSKWGIGMSKWEFQLEVARARGAMISGEKPKPENLKKYFPDITNPEFQRIFLSWARKQMECGVDSIWIDMLFMQTRIMKKLTKDESHSAVVESYRSAVKIVKKLKEYGVFVGTWNPPTLEGEKKPPIDYVTLSISSKEVLNGKLNEELWIKRREKIINRFGDISMYVVLDWGITDTSPLAVFSQKLSEDEQKVFLELVDKFLRKNGMIFLYPVHGGFIGPNAKKLAFGKYRFYDALAFNTYEKIRELAHCY